MSKRLIALVASALLIGGLFIGAPETTGTFDAPASVGADAECVGEGLVPASLEGLTLESVQPPTMSGSLFSAITNRISNAAR